MGRIITKEDKTGGKMSEANEIISLIESRQDVEEFQKLNWKGSFEEYLNIVLADPKVVRTAFERIYDMIMSHGTEEFTEYKKKIIKYLDFMAGYKTYTGVIVAILSLVLGSILSEGEIVELVTRAGEVGGGLMVIYGLIMKIIRSNK